MQEPDVVGGSRIARPSAIRSLRADRAVTDSSAARADGTFQMNALRILHIDDEPDIRAVVQTSLGQDPAFTVRSCGSGRDALAIVSDWSPHLILSDVAMPGMDGPAMLARLRGNEQTSRIPVVFMTARAAAGDREHLRGLGAAGVIAKPFDPMTLPECVRGHLRAAGMKALFHGFMRRLQSDVKALAECRTMLELEPDTTPVLASIRAFAHALAGAAGVFGLHEIGRRAGELEEAVIGICDADVSDVKLALNRLIVGVNPM